MCVGCFILSHATYLFLINLEHLHYVFFLIIYLFI